MKIYQVLLTAGILSTCAYTANAQLRFATKSLTISRSGDVLTAIDAGGKHLTQVDLTKPALKGKVIAFAYSSKKKEINEETAEPTSSLTLFPNPASRQVEVDLQGDWKFPVDVQIFDKSGNVSKAEQLESSRQTLNIESLTQGIYILKAISGEVTAVKKLVVQ